jgi:hypothetical protein
MKEKTKSGKGGEKNGYDDSMVHGSECVRHQCPFQNVDIFLKVLAMDNGSGTLTKRY